MEEKLYSFLHVKEISEDKREFRGIATTPEVDRQGDIVEPMGVKFKNPIPLLLRHDHSLPVGTVELGRPTKDGIPFVARIPEIANPSGLKARVDEAWESVKYGIMRAVSIGFRGLEWSIIEETGGIRFTKSELLELSIVAVPANSGATIQQIKALDRQAMASKGDELAGRESELKPSAKPEQPKTVKTVKTVKNQKEDKMKITEQLKQFRDTLMEKQANLVVLGEKSADETFSADEQEEFDTLANEVDQLKGHIKRLEVAEKAAMYSAKPVTEQSGNSEKEAVNVRSGVPAKRQEKLEKGIEFARYVMCLVAAQGDHTKAANIASLHYKESRVSNVLGHQAKGYDLVSKAAVPAGSTITGEGATWGSALVDYQDFTADFIEYLYPKTILGKFGTAGIPSLRRIPFNVTIKGQTSKATAGWVGEGKSKPVTSAGFNTVNLGWFKVAAIAVITEELIRFSDPNAERLVRDILVKAVVERLDTDFINPAKSASAGVSPASILNGVSAIPSVGTDAEAIACDLQALEDAFINANNDAATAVYIMRPQTANVLGRLQNALGQSQYPGINARGGTLLGAPVITSNYVPSGTVALINAEDIFLADDGQVRVDASREASLVMDSAPTGMDSVTPTDAETVSMFQTNSVAIRAEKYINWARARNSAVAHLSGVAWSACAAS